MFSLTDESCWTLHRKILTSTQTQLPWLQSFGMQTSSKTEKPLATHIHPGCLEIVFLLKGFQIYETAGQLFQLTGYDIFVTQTDEPHSSGDFPEHISDLMWFQIRPDALSETFPSEKASELAVFLQKLPRIFRGNALLENHLREAFFLLASPDPVKKSLGQQIFSGCLYRIILLAREIRPMQADQISEAVVYIHEHIQEAISLEDAARSCGLSLSRFKSKFKEETGITPRAFINNVKIARAKQLLQEKHSVTEVSDLLSFDTPNYFATLFKKYTGKTPSQYQAERAAEQSADAGAGRAAK